MFFRSIEFLERCFRPHVLFTGGEETGGIGASEFSAKYSGLDVKYMIELDRRGTNDAVFYSCGNQEFQDYICDKTSFIKSWGSFSDISTLMSVFEVAGVNLSSGYFNEHSLEEYVDLKALWRTLNKVEVLLNDASNVGNYDAQIRKYTYNYPNQYNGGYANYFRKYDEFDEYDFDICKKCPLITEGCDDECFYSGSCKALFEAVYTDKFEDSFDIMYHITNTIDSPDDRVINGYNNKEHLKRVEKENEMDVIV